jgi:hypothetical protein
MCLDYGVIPQSYLSDNDKASTSHTFELHLKNFSQHIRFAGAGAHHHNGHCKDYDASLGNSLAGCGQSLSLAHGRPTRCLFVQPHACS